MPPARLRQGARHKRRWTALTAFLIVVLVDVVVYTFTATPIYEARVQMLIETENPNVVSFKEAIEQEKTTNDYYQTQYKILQSRSLARRTLDPLKLWDSFDPSRRRRSRSASADAVRTPVALVAGLFRSAKPIEPPAADETTAQSQVARPLPART